jgi:hypothetical protein
MIIGAKSGDVQKQAVRLWIGFKWLRAGPTGRQFSFWFPKRRGIFKMCERDTFMIIRVTFLFHTVFNFGFKNHMIVKRI